jgi:hypothetical protein
VRKQPLLKRSIIGCRGIQWAGHAIEVRGVNPALNRRETKRMLNRQPADSDFDTEEARELMPLED